MNNGQRSALFLAGGLAAGFAVATLLRTNDAGTGWPSAAGGSLDGRIVELERRLASEAAARRALEEEIGALRGELELVAAANGAARLDDEDTGRAGPALFRRADSTATEAGAEPAAAPAGTEGPRARMRRAPPTPEELEQRRIQRFIEAGFTYDRATWIEQRTAELQMQQLEAQYEAARSGEPGRIRNWPSVEDALRAELGDAEYERYLDATGRPTRVAVRNVLPSSPAAQAGLQPGDEIVGYGGKRVFDLDDLNRLTLEGRPGESVVLEVVREGQPMQLYVPRGPIGISGGGGRRLP